LVWINSRSIRTSRDPLGEPATPGALDLHDSRRSAANSVVGAAPAVAVVDPFDPPTPQNTPRSSAHAAPFVPFFATARSASSAECSSLRAAGFCQEGGVAVGAVEPDRLPIGGEAALVQHRNRRRMRLRSGAGTRARGVAPGKTDDRGVDGDCLLRGEDLLGFVQVLADRISSPSGNS